jgi:hypothetical protein
MWDVEKFTIRCTKKMLYFLCNVKLHKDENVTSPSFKKQLGSTIGEMQCASRLHEFSLAKPMVSHSSLFSPCRSRDIEVFFFSCCGISSDQLRSGPQTGSVTISFLQAACAQFFANG